MLYPDRYSEETGIDTDGKLFFYRKLRVCRCRRLNYQCFSISHICKMTYQLKVLDKFNSLGFFCFQNKTQNSSGTLREIFFCKFMIRTCLKTRIINLLNARLGFKPFRQGKCILNMTFHPKRQGLKSLDKQKRVEWTYCRAKIP